MTTSEMSHFAPLELGYTRNNDINDRNSSLLMRNDTDADSKPSLSDLNGGGRNEPVLTNIRVDIKHIPSHSQDHPSG